MDRKPQNIRSLKLEGVTEEEWSTMTGFEQVERYRLSSDDEAALREHHDGDGGYERCVICRLLASLDYERLR